MVKTFFVGLFFCCYALTSFASKVNDPMQPVLITSTASELAETCLRDNKCAKKISAIKGTLASIYHSFNVMHYDKSVSPFKYATSTFKASFDQNAKKFRELAISDSEQVISFAIQDFETMDAGKKLRLKIYTVLFTEGSLFFVQAHVTFISSNGGDKWQVDSYEVYR